MVLDTIILHWYNSNIVNKGEALKMKNALVVQQHSLHKNADNLSGLVDRFMQYVDVSPSSGRAYVKGIRRFLSYTSQNGITAPTRDTVIKYKKHLTTCCSANTTALYMSSLRRFFAWLSSEGIYSDITSGIKSPRIDKGHRKDAFTAPQLKAVITGIDRKTVKGKRNFALVALVSACGLRTIEASRANVEDVRSTGGQAVLYIQGKGRNDKTEFVKLSEPVLQAIRDYLATRGDCADSEPLFTSTAHRNAGQRLSTQSISKIIKASLRQAGFNSKRLTAHSLRHSAITLALLAGLPLQDVSIFARHSNISVTMIYAHDVERLKSRCENAISTAIFDD